MGKILKEIKPFHIYGAAIALFILDIAISYLRVGQFYGTISEFGADTRIALVYNFILFISGILATIGCVQLCRENFSKYGRVRSFLLLTSTAAISFIALFPLGISQQVRSIHHIFVVIVFIGMSICMILFATLFYRVKQNIFLTLTILGILEIVQLVIFYINRQHQTWQWLGILGILIFHFMLFRYSSDLSVIKDEFEELA